LIAALACVAVFTSAGVALAHRERPIDSPVRSGSVPDENRVLPNEITVCKPTAFRPLQQHGNGTGNGLVRIRARTVQRCKYSNIQEAVNAASDNTVIHVMPGVYREDPSRRQPTSKSGDLPNGAYSFEYHVAHPNDANLIAILGKKNITLEGMGADPDDVVIDAGFVKDVVVRCDRCDGFIVRNLTAINANEHGIYVVDSDGYVFDHAIGAYSLEYELFSFASDHGVYHDCEAIGGGDSGVYIGGAPDTSGENRFSAELRTTKMHHNALGFSGTQGTSVWMHDNDVYDNSVGISFDSENDHPNFPERKSLIENNDFHDNNFDIYASDSDVPPKGPAFDFFHYPIGTGFWIIGGEDNVIRNNRVWNNKSFGFILAGNALESPLPAEVHRNSFENNVMGTAVGGGAKANGYGFPAGGDVYSPGGTDFFWDGTGNDNCWGPNGNVTGYPNPLPGPCPQQNQGATAPSGEQLDLLLACLINDSTTGQTGGNCPFGTRNHAPKLNRNQRALIGSGSVSHGGGGGGSY
jgi:hypothetical protein